MKAEIAVDEPAIAREHKKPGRFVLATNDLCLTADEIGSYRKSRSTVERGSRFLKDKSFHVSEVYLKGTQNRSIVNDYDIPTAWLHQQWRDPSTPVHEA